jgi:cytochrome d ubiquinol oxidase subunit I
VLFAVPDKDTETNRFEIAIPKLASLYLTYAWDGEIKGIKDFGEQHPPVAPVFWSFRIMVGVGMLMLSVSWLGSWQLRKNALQPWMARVLVGMTFAGWVALVAGWYTAEIGRQPWLVQGILTAAQAASKVPARNIAFTLAMYLITYAILLSAYVSVVFHLARKAANAETSVSEHAKPDASADAVTNTGAAHA